MTEQDAIDAKIAAMELLMLQGYISLTKYLEFLRRVKSK